MPLAMILLAAAALPMTATPDVLIGIGEIWKYRPADTRPHPDWNAVAFDDGEWSSGPSGFSVGYGTYDEATVLPSVPGNYPSVFFRKSFFLEEADSLIWPTLRVDFNDGFVAYLNGVEVVRSGLTGTPPAFDQASVPRSRGNGLEIPLENHLGVFREGTNVLAFQVHNSSLTNATLALIPELLSGITRGPIIASTSSNQTLVTWKTPVPVLPEA